METILNKFLLDLNSLRLYVSTIHNYIELENNKFSLKDTLKNGGFSINKKPEDDKIIISIDKTLVSIHEIEKKLVGIIETHQHQTSRSEILLKTSYIHIICIAEGVFAQILHNFYKKNQFPINKDEKYFSLSRLEQIGSIDEARSYIINEHIESILRQNFLKWLDTLEKDLRVDLVIHENDKNDIYEMFLIRNLLVHNNSKINKTFIHRLPSCKKEHYKLDEVISISESSLLDSIKKIESFFLKIIYRSWKKLDYEDFIEKNPFVNIAYTFAEAERFEEALSFFDFMLKEKGLREVDLLTCQANIWIIQKNTNAFTEEIRAKIKNFDVTAKALKFRLVKYALLDEDDSFFKLLPKVLESQEISISSAKEWPAFKQQRLNPLFDQIVKEVERKIESKLENNSSSSAKNSKDGISGKTELELKKSPEKNLKQNSKPVTKRATSKKL